MDHEHFKRPNFRHILKDAVYLDPLKESVPAFVFQLLERAVKCWEEGDIAQAKVYISEFNAHVPRFHIGRLVELALDIHEHEPEEVLSYLKGIPPAEIKGELMNCLYHAFRACLHFSLWDIDEARDECTKALLYRHADPAIYYIRGTCYSLRGAHELAISDFKKALKGDYNRKEVMACLAYSYLSTRRYWRALWLHRKIVDHFPDNAKIQYYTGICYKRFRNFTTAITYFDRAIQLDPNHAMYKLTRGRELMRVKRFQDADADLRAAAAANIPIAIALQKINTEVLEQTITPQQATKKIRQLLVHPVTQ